MRSHTVTLFAIASALAYGVYAQPAGEHPTLDLSAPLGTPSNPVRARMPTGQRDYLMRLRCGEGDAPSFEREGSVGVGPYGNMLDLYKVTCASGKAFGVYMDMYHRHREIMPVPGFSALTEHPGRLAQGCPPEGPGVEPGKYVFHFFEVEQRARLPGFQEQVAGYPLQGNVFVRVIVEADGSISPEKIEILYSSTETIRMQAMEYVSALRFEPAEHRPGCRVPQRVEFHLSFK